MGGDLHTGGIWGLLDLIEEHRGAVEYDWRSRFHLGLDSLPESMGWDEAARLALLLRSDPSSAIAAALEGWEFAASREALALYDLFDLEHEVNSKRKPKPHPGRPWAEKPAMKQKGNAKGRSPEEMKAILREHFGQPEAPV